jgi:hypothetical protein
MTEEEWLVSSTNPAVMLDQLQSQSMPKRPSNRKLRLIAVACSQRIKILAKETDQQIITEALVVAERFAEGNATEAELTSIFQLLNSAGKWETNIVLKTFDRDAVRVARNALVSVGNFAKRSLKDKGVKRIELVAQAHLIRCVFGNPFRPITLNPSWRTSTVTALARQVYDSRDFSAMPILADALQDAGCDNAAILEHCRGTGTHARGCWVLDLLLAKE